MTYDSEGRVVRDPDAPVNVNSSAPGYAAPAYVDTGPTPVSIARRVIERHGGQIWSPVGSSTSATAAEAASRGAIVLSIPLRGA